MLLIYYLDVQFQSSSRWLLHCLTELRDAVKGGFVLDTEEGCPGELIGQLHSKLGLWKSLGRSRSKVLGRPALT